MNETVRILIVEDKVTDFELAQREIRRAVDSCEFQRVETRKEFLNALETFQPDVVLSDYKLPRFNGMEALKLLQQQAPLIPIILWTGSLSEDIAVESMKAGANNYVIKENIRRLGPAVIHALEERKMLLERKTAEERIQRQIEYLTALRTIDVALISSFDLRVVLDVVLQHILTQLGANASAVLLVGADSITMEYSANRGFRSRTIQHTQLKLGEGYAGRATAERRTVHVTDLMRTGRVFANAPHLAGEDFVDYYGIPLIVKGEVKGILEVYHRAPLNLSSEQLGFMETLAGQAAIAIDNSQLLQNLQRSNAQLELRVIERTAELNRTNRELEHANQAKDEFLATMSHELRTPLNSILGLSETLLEQRQEPLSEQQQKSLEIIATSGRHLLELINDVLDLSKIEAGKFDYYPQAIEVNALCQSSLSFIRGQAMRKSIDVRYEEDKTVDKIHADPRRLKQVLVNLLTNAVKFTPENGMVTLQVRSDADRDLIQFSVIDTGIGIAREDLNKLFQPFSQVDSSLTREFEGTGLGLALVQRLTDLHGGSVEVESEPGRGSRFTVSIPWRRDLVAEQEAIESSARPPGKKAEKTKAHSASLGTLLLAEDNMANILTIGEYLESHGYEVMNAQDGLQAIEMAEKINPKLILMDIQMPALDGLEAIRRLRKNPRFASTPIIALTALAMPGDRERCLEAGANEYMSKPVSLKALVKTMDDLLVGER
jgi:signal transduction histidine kinase